MLTYFYVCVREKELNFNFQHEHSQDKNRTIDIAAMYNNYEQYNETITVIECKRLFVPEKDRKDEYITGHKKTGGGIQRFKIEAHGKEHDIVGMIGYVQTQTILESHKLVNDCISNLSKKSDDGLSWDIKEQIKTIEHDTIAKKYRGVSTHPRKIKGDIVIHHLWIDMQGFVIG